MTTTPTNDSYDVLIVGYGPIGRMLALQLGSRGHRVLVTERQKAVYFLPRAVHLDDEISRVLQSVGMPPTALPDAVGPYDDFYEWRAADKGTLMRLDWRGRGPSGWNVSNFFNQPQLERELDARVRNLPTVDIALGWKAIDRAEHEEGVDVELEDADGGHRMVRASYVIGADGANSVVRDWIGAQETDLGYFHDWLVVDLIMKNDAITFDPPAWQLCDPERPTTLVPGGPGRRRFEFMRLPDELLEDLNNEETTWRLLEPWGIGPDDADLERHVVYRFQAKWADIWQRDRIFIAGDAAHLMPPFAGQGMCSGIRDAVNLAWKLDLVLTGRVSDRALADYSAERLEHVRHFIAASMALGEVVCITDPIAARARDEKMKADLAAGVETPPRPLPRLGSGLHREDAGGGLLSIQGLVDAGDGAVLFDDAIGSGGVLILAEAAGDLDAARREELQTLGFRTATVGAHAREGVVADVDGTYAEWFDSLGAVAVLVRPDFYVYGIATAADEVGGLVDGFLEHVGAKSTA